MKTRPDCRARRYVARITVDGIRKFISILSGVGSRKPIGHVPFFVIEGKGEEKCYGTQHTWLNDIFSKAEKIIMAIKNTLFDQMRSRHLKLLVKMEEVNWWRIS